MFLKSHPIGSIFDMDPIKMTAIRGSVNNEITYMPICSMYGIFTYIRFKFMVNVGKNTIHGLPGFAMDVPLWLS